MGVLVLIVLFLFLVLLVLLVTHLVPHHVGFVLVLAQLGLLVTPGLYPRMTRLAEFLAGSSSRLSSPGTGCIY